MSLALSEPITFNGCGRGCAKPTGRTGVGVGVGVNVEVTVGVIVDEGVRLGDGDVVAVCT